MAKESLSSDIDFIKEFEQLKLRQKLLINSINKNHKDEHNSLLLEIDKKLEFLVKIFQEVKENDQDDHVEKKIDLIQETQEKNQAAILEKLIAVENSFDEKLEELFSKVHGSSLKKPVELDNTNQNQEIKSEVDSKDSTKKEKLLSEKSAPKENLPGLPPVPEFKVDKSQQKEDKKNKKKWF